jgi:hypothetical protein
LHSNETNLTAPVPDLICEDCIASREKQPIDLQDLVVGVPPEIFGEPHLGPNMDLENNLVRKKMQESLLHEIGKELELTAFAIQLQNQWFLLPLSSLENIGPGIDWWGVKCARLTDQAHETPMERCSGSNTVGDSNWPTTMVIFLPWLISVDLASSVVVGSFLKGPHVVGPDRDDGAGTSFKFLGILSSLTDPIIKFVIVINTIGSRDDKKNL